MAVIKGTLEALDRALDDKNFMKNASMDSQELWLACIALQQCVKSEENVPLEPKIQAIGKTISATYSPTYHSRATECLQKIRGTHCMIFMSRLAFIYYEIGNGV